MDEELERGLTLLGIESNNFIEINGNFLITFFGLIMLYIVKKINHKGSLIEGLVNKLYHLFFFRVPIIMMKENITIITISCLIGFPRMTFSGGAQTF